MPGHVVIQHGLGSQGYTPAQSLASTLYHYTTASGREGIEASYMLNPTTTGGFGIGQYFTDIPPEDFTRAEMDRIMPRHYKTVDRIGDPSFFFQIHTEDLTLYQGVEWDLMAGDRDVPLPHNRFPGVFLHINNEALDISGRIIRRGAIDLD